MRFHLLALPNSQTTKAYSLDGFAQCTIRFTKLLKSLGHTVFLYASEENEAPCDELITVISKEEQTILLDGIEYQHAMIDERWPMWQLGNKRAIKAIGKRKEDKDFLCLIGGASQKPVADAHPDLPCIEYSIGYTGSFSPYRVFESTAWRHCTYGFQNHEDGRFFDEVIPCFFEPEEFPFSAESEDYFLYCGRFINRKGVQIACDAAKAANVELKLIGHGSEMTPNYGENLGAISMPERNRIMSKAKAVFCPTRYIEPFCCVGVEAQLCGTPVISTDFGGFTETVEQGKTGFRCSYLGEFVDAIRNIGQIDRNYVRARAVEKYSIENVAPQYQRYFNRVSLLWGKGWDTVHETSTIN